MAKNKNKKTDSQALLESPDFLREKLTQTEDYIEHHKGLVFSIMGVLVAAIIGFFVFRYYIRSQNNKAETDMFQAIYYYEADSLNKALSGDGNNLGFLDVIDEYPLTKTGNLAHFYAGIIYLKKGQYDNAIEQLSKFKSNDIAVQARSFSLIGDAYMEKGDFSQAGIFYRKAADYKPNEYLTPQYLEKAANAYEKLMDYESASDCYNKIITDFYSSSHYQNALKQKARVDGLAKK